MLWCQLHLSKTGRKEKRTAEFCCCCCCFLHKWVLHTSLIYKIHKYDFFFLNLTTRHGMWDSVPPPGIKPMSLALEGGVLTTGPLGKSHKYSYWYTFFLDIWNIALQQRDSMGIMKWLWDPSSRKPMAFGLNVAAQPVPLKDSVPSYCHPALLLIFSLIVIRTAFPALPPHPSGKWRQTLSHQLFS